MSTRDAVFHEPKRRNHNALPMHTILDSRYEVGRVLGQGGFGITYAAWDTQYQTTVAIKEFFPQGLGVERKFADGKILPDLDIPDVKIDINGLVRPLQAYFLEQVSRFQAEARKLAQFRQTPNIAIVLYDFTQYGTAYYVMEYYTGVSLWEAWEKNGRKPWPLSRVMKVLSPMIKALEKVHAKGIIHRDFKPHNVLLVQEDGEESAVLIDFGIAKETSSQQGGGVTTPISLIGTPLYAPYEQQSPYVPHGAYSDVYSVAATLYQLLTGKLPVPATEREAALRHNIPDPMAADYPGVPAGFKAFMEKALAVYPKDRYQTMKDFREALDQVLKPAAPAVAPAAKPAPAPHLFTNSVGMTFVKIPAGSFLMGSSDRDDMAYGDEKPQHRVNLTKDFYMGQYPVTQAAWQAVMGNNPSHFKGANRPVECVSWVDAQEFIRKLNQKEGTDAYRLPTEAEWEYACRAGGTTRYTFGDNPDELKNYAWYGDSDNGTHPVGKKNANAWGLYDMHGNVWEWVEDGYEKDYYQRSPSSNPCNLTQNSKTFRVLRGGSWGSEPLYLRAASRYYNDPADRYSRLGFRLAKTL